MCFTTRDKKGGIKKKKGESVAKRRAFMIDPQSRFQALYATQDSSRACRSRDAAMQATLSLLDEKKHRYRDFSSGSVMPFLYDHRGVYRDPCSIAYTVSSDGASLSLVKKSGFTIVILDILNILPEEGRSRPGSNMPLMIIPGPLPVLDYDSFFRLIYSKLREFETGCWIWDALDSAYFVLQAFKHGEKADIIESTKRANMTGHQAHCGCTVCEMPGVQLPSKQGPHYMPCTTPFRVEDNMHRPLIPGRADFHPYDLPERTEQSYTDALLRHLNAKSKEEHNRIQWQTGIKGPSLSSQSAAFFFPTHWLVDGAHLLFEDCFLHIYDTLSSKPKIQLGDNARYFLSGDEQRLFGEYVVASKPWMPMSIVSGHPRSLFNFRNTFYKMHELETTCMHYFIPFLIELHKPQEMIETMAYFVEGVALSIDYDDEGMSKDDVEQLETCFVEFWKGWERLYYRGVHELVNRCTHALHRLLHIRRFIDWHGPIVNYTQFETEREIKLTEDHTHSLKDPFSNMANQMVVRECLSTLDILLPQPKQGPRCNRGPSMRTLQGREIFCLSPKFGRLSKDDTRARTQILAMRDWFAYEGFTTMGEKVLPSDARMSGWIRWGKVELPIQKGIVLLCLQQETDKRNNRAARVFQVRNSPFSCCGLSRMR